MGFPSHPRGWFSIFVYLYAYVCKTYSIKCAHGTQTSFNEAVSHIALVTIRFQTGKMTKMVHN